MAIAAPTRSICSLRILSGRAREVVITRLRHCSLSLVAVCELGAVGWFLMRTRVIVVDTMSAADNFGDELSHGEFNAKFYGVDNGGELDVA